MTKRERLVAVSSGQRVDRQPVVGWNDDPSLDAIVVSPIASDIKRELDRTDAAVLAQIPNPFHLGDSSILRTLEEDPKEGERQLAEISDGIRRQIDESLEAEADGIFYCLYGATPSSMSPMAYGGHFLELDRDLLYAAQNALFNLVFVVGGAGTYLDFVSDLPAEALGWDASGTGITIEEVRKMRKGPLATETIDADIRISAGSMTISKFLEEYKLGSAV